MAEGRNEPRSVHFGDLSSTPTLQKNFSVSRTKRAVFAFLSTLSSFPERGENEKELGKMAKGTRERENLHHQFFYIRPRRSFSWRQRRRGFLATNEGEENNQAVGEAQRKSARVCAAKELERAGGRARGLQRQRQRRRLRMQVIVDSLLFGKTLFRDVIGSTRSRRRRRRQLCKKSSCCDAVRSQKMLSWALMESFKKFSSKRQIQKSCSTCKMTHSWKTHVQLNKSKYSCHFKHSGTQSATQSATQSGALVEGQQCTYVSWLIKP